MTATEDTPEAGAEVAGSGPPPGARLAEARAAAGLSVDDIARELHLEAYIVAAIERGNLDVLGAPVFVKGYLRGYARLVGLPEQEIMDAWTPADAAAGQLRPLAAAPNMKTGTSLSMFALWVALGLLLLAAAIYVLAGGDDAPVPATAPADPAARSEAAALPAPRVVLRENFVVTAPAPAAAVAAPATVADAAEPGSDAVAETASDATADAVAAVAATAGTSGAPAAPAAMPAEAGIAEPASAPGAVLATSIAPGRVSLQLSFDAECWIELADSRRRLLYGLEKAGSVRNFDAEPPLRFFVGNVDAVRIRLGSLDYQVPDSVRTGRNTARFALDAADIGALQ